ncbi:MAG: beta-N-acetylhexosaminidase [Clostridiales bacterium]|nr:beta-N-acetylhexosaminidase [Clostridiales bacterium]
MLKLIPQPEIIEYKKGLSKNIVSYKQDAGIASQGYEIDADADGIVISYSDEKGKFYGQKTVEQIIRQSQFGIPQVHIKDAPKYEYRGFMMDCSRHFFTIGEIKKYLDTMADLKLNKFHWHITDDQGWRIEIKKYPNLTEIGSKRNATRDDGVEVSGYYMQDEIKEIVAYAKERFIDVIPEIDMPGHFTAAIASYNYLGCQDKSVKVSESFGIHAEIACAGKDSTYEFCKDVLKEVFELFPYKYIHLGGDEALKLRWINCPHCQNKMEENNLSNEEQLQGYFMNSMVAFAKEHGKTVINWNDGLCGGNIDNSVILQYWKESKLGKKVLYSQSKKGRKIIMSPFYSYYMDYPYGMTNLKKTYNYDVDKVLDDDVLGLEAPIWTEYVENAKKLEYMVFPRLIAVAERAWSKQKDYDGFLVRLKEYYNYLDGLEINYASDYNPNKIKGLWQVLRFFANANDRTNRKNFKLLLLNNKAVKKKYGKKNQVEL